MSFTDLNAVKNQLGIPLTDTSKDAALQPIVDAANAEVLAIFCLDDCPVTEYLERHDIDIPGQQQVGLKRWPVVAITELKNDGSVVDPLAFGFRKNTGHIRLDSGSFAIGRRTVHVTFTAGWATPDPRLVYAATSMAAATWSLDETPGLKSETIGRYKYTKQEAGDAKASAETILSKYRRWMPRVSTLD